MRFWKENFCFLKLTNVKTAQEAKGSFQYCFFLVKKKWISCQKDFLKNFMLFLYVIKNLSAWKRKLKLYQNRNKTTRTVHERKRINEIKLTEDTIAFSFCFYLHHCITEASFWRLKWEFEWGIFLNKLWNKYNLKWSILRKIKFLLIWQS